MTNTGGFLASSIVNANNANLSMISSDTFLENRSEEFKMK